MEFEVDSLFIEVTRRCTLECRHCFRGEQEDKDISLEVLENTFRGIKSINHLLLTGGEPFLAHEQFKKIREILERDHIKVKYISIVTNATFLNDAIMEALSYFNNNSRLNLYVSEDKFHEEELKRLGILTQRDENIATLENHFGLNHYAQSSIPLQWDKIGRAATLSEEDLKLINESGKIKTQYCLGTEKDLEIYRQKYIKPYIYEDNISGIVIRLAHGVVYIDVNGNIAPVDYSYIEADAKLYFKYDNHKNIFESIKEMEKTDQGKQKKLVIISKKPHKY